jgi:DNA-binding XRE family transcriptional regulator
MKDLLTAAKVAKIVGVSRQTVYDWKNEGAPKGLKHAVVYDRVMFKEEWIYQSERAVARMAEREVMGRPSFFTEAAG